MPSQLLFGYNPSVLVIKIFLITVYNPRQFLLICLRAMRTSKLGPQLLPLILSDVNRIAAMTAAVLAPVRWQACPALISWNLAQTSLSLLAEGFHALAATTIFDYEAIVLLSESVLFYAHFAPDSVITSLLALLLAL